MRRDVKRQERREADKMATIRKWSKGCQYSWRGINRTYVQLRTGRAVNLNLWKSLDLIEQGTYLVSYVHTSTDFSSTNFLKLGLVWCLKRPTEFH